MLHSITVYVVVAMTLVIKQLKEFNLKELNEAKSTVVDGLDGAVAQGTILLMHRYE